MFLKYSFVSVLQSNGQLGIRHTETESVARKAIYFFACRRHREHSRLRTTNLFVIFLVVQQINDDQHKRWNAE
jgi:hypothetical protein